MVPLTSEHSFSGDGGGFNIHIPPKNYIMSTKRIKTITMHMVNPAIYESMPYKEELLYAFQKYVCNSDPYI